MIVLETIKLGKKFRQSEEWAVKNFDLEVHSGEIFGLLGESGCGKTTILRMIAGFELPSTGVIKLNGKVVSSETTFVEPQNRNIGIVFQDYALFPHKTVWENVCFGLFRYTKTQIKQKAKEILHICGLDTLEKRYPHQLSGGQMQRVALARALAPEPELILFDEPFSNIDSMRKFQMREDILSIIKKTDATAIFVTHDTKDVLAMADRVSVIRKGEALQTDTPGRIYAEPLNTYVADFFGKANIIKAQVSGKGFLTSMGLIEGSSGVMPENQKVTLSIRPEDFEITDKSDDCFCGHIVKERFFGEYKEITCLVPGTNGEETQIIIYVSPHLQCKTPKCYFKPRDRHVNIMRGEK